MGDADLHTSPRWRTSLLLLRQILFLLLQCGVMMLSILFVSCGQAAPVGSHLGRGGMILEMDIPSSLGGTTNRISVHNSPHGILVVRGSRQPDQASSNRYVVLQPEEWKRVEDVVQQWCNTLPGIEPIDKTHDHYEIAFVCQSYTDTRHIFLEPDQLPLPLKTIIEVTFDTQRYTTQ